MTTVKEISDGFWRWLDQVAEATVTLVARIAASNTIRLVETANNHFVIENAEARKSSASGEIVFSPEEGGITSRSAAVGANLRGHTVELVLQPERFVFKPLELPSRATEFLAGVVRAQIDRLTPWRADHAAFGCTKPSDAGGGRIVVTVAATAKDRLAPYLRAFAGLGIRSLTVSTRVPGAAADVPAITILEQNVGGILDVAKARQILLATLVGSGLLAVASLTAATILGGNLQARQDELAHRIAERRAAAIAARNVPLDPMTAAERALAQRKNETPSSVIVLEILSQILPDHTYVTEMRIEGDKLRITGITHDAPGLIRLIEHSRHFADATFFAPTTRTPSDPGDRFNIEARLKPVFSPQL